MQTLVFLVKDNSLQSPAHPEILRLRVNRVLQGNPVSLESPEILKNPASRQSPETLKNPANPASRQSPETLKIPANPASRQSPETLNNPANPASRQSPQNLKIRANPVSRESPETLKNPENRQSPETSRSQANPASRQSPETKVTAQSQNEVRYQQKQQKVNRSCGFTSCANLKGDHHLQFFLVKKFVELILSYVVPFICLREVVLQG